MSSAENHAFDQRVAAAVTAALAQMNLGPAAAVAAGPAPAQVNVVGVKLPEFWVADPDLWFFQAEASFRNARVTVSRTKFDHVVMKLPEAVSMSLRAFLLGVTEATEDPYGLLKDRLITVYGKTRWQRAFALLHHPDLGDRRPSQMMGEMMSLLPTGCTADTVFLALYLTRLPSSMRDHLAAADFDTAEEMAAHADLLWDARNNQQVSAVDLSVDAVSQRSVSPGDRRGRSPDRHRQQREGFGKNRQQTPHGDGRRRDSSWCSNHKRLGKRTRNCIPPCSWQAEN